MVWRHNDTGGLADRPNGKSLPFQLYYLAYVVGRQNTTFTSCENAACSNEFFSPAGRL